MHGSWGHDMSKDGRSIVQVLRSELEFLDRGGYTRKTSWGPQCIFEDSPTCVNYGQKGRPNPCDNCPLMQFVPAEHRSEKIPCRYIPLDASGETLDSLYRYCNQEQVEGVVRGWLRATIKRLEDEPDGGQVKQR